MRVAFSTASEQATRKASSEFAEKSAANRIVRKGCLGVLLERLSTRQGGVPFSALRRDSG
jgi:hypothetical protein